MKMKNRSSARTVSVEAVMQPRFCYAEYYVSFDAEVLVAFWSSETFVLGSDRRRLAGFTGRFPRSFISFLLSSSMLSTSSAFPSLFFSSTLLSGCFVLRWFPQLLYFMSLSHAKQWIMRRCGSVAEAGVPVISPRISFLLFFRRDADIWAFQMLKILGALLLCRRCLPLCCICCRPRVGHPSRRPGRFVEVGSHILCLRF